MGSTGTGRFTDYPGSTVKSPMGKNIAGGKSNTDQCSVAFISDLEEIQNCAYYKAHNSVPNKSAKVYVQINKRICVVLKSSNEILGYLPTKYNYIAKCISDGFSYLGIISNSFIKPLPSISVDIGPEKNE